MDSYKKLDLRIQKWLFNQGWSDLREIQKKAIDPILSAQSDVLISASTAAGKTEAFFLPALTATADMEEGFNIVYISPLKALINDQFRRLSSLCESIDMCLTPWHGDSSSSLKKKAREKPSGVLLITPESIEAMLIRHASWAQRAFKNTQYIVIDEFHAFIGTERGYQLLSLLNRLEHLLGRLDDPIPRVALSATLGELEAVPSSLRPNKKFPCVIITSSHGYALIKIQVRGYLDRLSKEQDESELSAEQQIIQYIYKLCRGKGSHLVFANSRRRTEYIAAALSDYCEKEGMPNEFFPHHGSLSKEFREELETRLQQESLPTTAICTMTLELGIDIGKVNSIIQVTAPHSVSSLRQRLGRSGRRGEAACLRMLISESEIVRESGPVDKLRFELVQSLAMVRLLIANQWFEPEDKKQLHLSTLVHQILSIIAQWGGIRTEQLFLLLCKHGPFQLVKVPQFLSILQHLGTEEIITQLESGELVLGLKGERIVGHYTFYAVFSTPEEYRVVHGTKTIGQLPIDSMVMQEEQFIIFGGQRWKVTGINPDEKVITVERAKGGNPPRFGGQGIGLHDMIRQEMLSIYQSGDYRIAVGNQKVDYADQSASSLFKEGVDYFNRTGLSEQAMIYEQGNVYIFPWLGDKIVNTLSALLINKGFLVSQYAGVVEVQKVSLEIIQSCLKEMRTEELPSCEELAARTSVKHLEKFDNLLPENLLNLSYGHRVFDIEGVRKWLITLDL